MDEAAGRQCVSGLGALFASRTALAECCVPDVPASARAAHEQAVKGMLPKGRLGRHLFTHMKVGSAAAGELAVHNLGCEPCVGATVGASSSTPHKSTEQRASLSPCLCVHPCLKVFKGTEHPHVAQQPVDITNRISKKPAEIAAAESSA